jgi:hypothetical protein
MKRLTAIAMMLLCSAAPFGVEAAPAHQDWTVAHQPDRFTDRTLMEAWADGDKSAARMELYCDTDNGFRIMFLPHRDLIPEGPSRITVTIDNAKPVVLDGDAFGDDDTDVVTIHDSEKLERALVKAHHVSAHFLGIDGKTGDDAFTFGDLSAQRDTLMRVCPVR